MVVLKAENTRSSTGVGEFLFPPNKGVVGSQTPIMLHVVLQQSAWIFLSKQKFKLGSLILGFEDCKSKFLCTLLRCSFDIECWVGLVFYCIL